VISNNQTTIIYESSVVIDGHIKSNKPNIRVYDKSVKRIYIIEIGATSAENLMQTEIAKKKI
jgi:hypothetical protein